MKTSGESGFSILEGLMTLIVLDISVGAFLSLTKNMVVLNQKSIQSRID